ncbi:MAG: hypothetical protein AAGH48_02350 [Pseudomonadota bacterium]
MSAHEVHSFLVGCHIVAGATGAIAFWAPVIGKKGGAVHKMAGRVFVWAMVTVGLFAVGMSLTTLYAPVETHPDFDFPEPVLRAVFGWMMLYLAILTINLAWYGRACVLNKSRHEANRHWANLALQGALLVAAANTAVRGVGMGEPLLAAFSLVGFATVATNCFFIFSKAPSAFAWLREHLKGLVGAGISVYTAFFAFGAVRLAPDLALSPLLWAAPLTIGLAIILWHWRQIGRRQTAQDASPRRASTPRGAATGVAAS